MRHLVAIVAALIVSVSAMAGERERCPDPAPAVVEPANVPSSDSSSERTIFAVLFTCIVIEAATDGTCRFWKWSVWKPKAQPVNTSSVPEAPVNEYLRVRTR